MVSNPPLTLSWNVAAVFNLSCGLHKATVIPVKTGIHGGGSHRPQPCAYNATTVSVSPAASALM